LLLVVDAICYRAFFALVFQASQASPTTSSPTQAKMSQLSTSSSDADVEWAIRDVMATKPLGHNMRWELEVSRRRIARNEADMRAAKREYDPLNKTQILKGSEIAAYEKAFREAQSKYSLQRNCWICSVGNAEDALRFAKLMDELAADRLREYIASKDERYCDDDYYDDDGDEEAPSFRFLSEAPEGSAEDVRNKALQKAERNYNLECKDVRADCSSFYRGSFERGRGSAMRSGFARAAEEYKEAVAAAEEAYYQARLAPVSRSASGGSA
jgi:hypothetical protein